MGTPLVFSLCLLSLFLLHGSSVVAQLQLPQHRLRAKTSCQIQQLNAREPTRRFDYEAGSTELWDSKSQEFECAGVEFARHTIQPKGLLLPHYTNSPQLVYIIQGSGIQGVVIPGCAETYESGSGSSSERERGEGRRSSPDRHQKLRRFRQGDILALQSGITHWTYNDGDTPIISVAIRDVGNEANQLDLKFRDFFLAGKPQPSGRSQGQEEEIFGRRSMGRTRRGEEKQDKRNILSGFESEFLAEAFNNDPETIRKVQGREGREDNRGAIVHAERLNLVFPEWSQQEQELERQQSQQEQEREQEKGQPGQQEREREQEQRRPGQQEQEREARQEQEQKREQERETRQEQEREQEQGGPSRHEREQEQGQQEQEREARQEQEREQEQGGPSRHEREQEQEREARQEQQREQEQGRQEQESEQEREARQEQEREQEQGRPSRHEREQEQEREQESEARQEQEREREQEQGKPSRHEREQEQEREREQEHEREQEREAHQEQEQGQQKQEHDMEPEMKESRSNGLEETLCSIRIRENIDNPRKADVYNPRAGRITRLNSQKLPILNNLRLNADRGVLYKNAMMAPHWSMNAHTLIYVIRGSARIQVVGNQGNTVFDNEARQGQLLVVPQNFAIVKKANEQGFEWVSFRTNDNAVIGQLSGRLSAIREMPEEVVMNAYGVSREEARSLKYNREEETLLSPGSRSA